MKISEKYLKYTLIFIVIVVAVFVFTQMYSSVQTGQMSVENFESSSFPWWAWVIIVVVILMIISFVQGYYDYVEGARRFQLSVNNPEQAAKENRERRIKGILGGAKSKSRK